MRVVIGHYSFQGCPGWRSHSFFFALAATTMAQSAQTPNVEAENRDEETRFLNRRMVR
jgi:hypothetical protein